MKTNFDRLKADLRTLLDSNRSPSSALLFLVFMLPVLTMVSSLTGDYHPFLPVLTYLAGGVVAWVLIRGRDDTPEATAKRATVEHRTVMESTALLAALVAKLGGKVLFQHGDLTPRTTTIHTTRHPDGSFQIEVKRHG